MSERNEATSLEALIQQLHAGDYSCVIAGNAETRIFTGRGVSDLYRLLSSEPEFLQGAAVADKVVGKGAAALMILGGVDRLYTDLISTKALELFRRFAPGIQIKYAQEVPFIWNRSHTGGCPVETLCSDVETPAEMLPLIKRFLEQMFSSSHSSL
jgi:iron complex outermembrane receptor protein